MTTDFGKELRKLRVDREERLLDMADRLEVSAAFISLLESGKKSISASFEELVITAYSLSESAADVLRRAADASRKAFLLSPNSRLGRDTAGLLARRINSLSDAELTKIKNILESKRDQK